MPVETRPTPTAAHERLRADDRLSELIDEHGYLVIEPATDPFERLVRAIGRQQVSMASAQATWERLTERFAVTPETMAEANPEALQDMGLSAAKSEYVGNVAEAFLERGWSRAAFEEQSDDAVFEVLTGVRGVGPWTAKMFLMFALGREDVFPVEDLGIRKAMEQGFGVETRSEMKAVAAAWAPHRSVASLYLWRLIESPTEGNV
jgi:DNA-3-methyladenine glycosylase II